MKWVSQTDDTGRADMLSEIMTNFVIPEEQEEWVDFLSSGRSYEVPAEPGGSGEDQEPETKFVPPPSLTGYVQLINWAIEQHTEKRPTTPS